MRTQRMWLWVSTVEVRRLTHERATNAETERDAAREQAAQNYVSAPSPPSEAAPTEVDPEAMPAYPNSAVSGALGF